MARKRLADLLREEAQKTDEQEGIKPAVDQSVIETIAPVPVASNHSAENGSAENGSAENGTPAKNGTTKTSTAKRGTTKTVATKTVATKSAAAGSTSDPSEQTDAQQNQLEALHIVEKALAQAQQREASLRQQIGRAHV